MRAPAVPSAVVAARGGIGSTAYEGVVEAVRQSVVAAQVSGAVVALAVQGRRQGARPARS